MICGKLKMSTHSFLLFCEGESLNRVQLFVTHRLVLQAPVFMEYMEFSRQEYWSGLPFPISGDLSDPGIDLGILHCRLSLPCEPPGKCHFFWKVVSNSLFPESELASVNFLANRILQECLRLSRLSYTPCCIHLGLLEHLLIEITCQFVRKHMQTNEEAHLRHPNDTLTELPAAAHTNLPDIWVSHLESETSSFTSPIPADATTSKKAIRVEISKNCRFASKINDCYHFKLLNFEIICNTAINNQSKDRSISEVMQIERGKEII